MNMANILLETRLVGDITGSFVVPSYQRGYRWGEMDIRRLVTDILGNGANPYCLQPIVVRKLEPAADGTARYELIDGQQRLTSLFLLYQCIHKESHGFLPGPKFSIDYETRPQSAQFLKDIDLSLRNDNIDFWYMAKAYETLKSLLVAQKDMTHINEYLSEKVSVIWYEVPETEDAISLFQRLNIGKIQLTPSELVKALFLRDTPEESVGECQEEIALQWDNMERELHDDDLWSFLTNRKTPKYATRIDLVLDLMAQKKQDDRDPLSTFFYFDDLSRQTKLYDVWKSIQAAFLQLKEWRYNHNLYHKIGYLIASESQTLQDIFNAGQNVRKSQFEAKTDWMIRQSLRGKEEDTNTAVDIDELQYGKDNALIQRILLLFNVESVRTISAEKQWFPFCMHKEKPWSLEHIHAQHSEGLYTNEQRRVWLTDHITSLEDLREDLAESDGRRTTIDSLVEEARKLVDDIDAKTKKNVGDEFNSLQDRIVSQLSLNEDVSVLHGIDNLALLDVGSNAALSNYVFDAKRNMIIKMDMDGAYIPYCTKMVFFKYYTPSARLQVHFWGPADRDAYKSNIKEKLSDYIDKK